MIERDKEFLSLSPLVQGYLSVTANLRRPNLSPDAMVNYKKSQLELIMAMGADDFRDLAGYLEERRLNDRKALGL